MVNDRGMDVIECKNTNEWEVLMGNQSSGERESAESRMCACKRQDRRCYFQLLFMEIKLIWKERSRRALQMNNLRAMIKVRSERRMSKRISRLVLVRVVNDVINKYGEMV